MVESSALQIHDMTLDFEGLMSILANSLYSEKKVFIRELVQNAHDSVRRAEERQKDHRGRIDIQTRPDDLTISFSDNGIGMNADDLRSFLARVGRSGTAELGRGREGVKGLIGQFGIGFLSGFIVAERIEVRTRKIDETEGWLWKNDGGKSYTIEPCDITRAGTTVTVFLKDKTDRGIIQVDSVQAVLREYADMLLVPIYVNHGTTPVNTMQMPWERDGVSDEERELDCQIYLHKTIRGDSIMETIPVVFGDDGQVGGILYISKTRTYGVRVPRNLRLHHQRMFVVNDAQLLPEWAEFVSGIINADRLTPNAARDGFIRNEAWYQLREALGALVIDHLEKLSLRNRKKLSFILKWHDLGIKAACYHHSEFFAKFANLLEWRVNRGALPTVSDDDAEDDRLFDSKQFRWRTLPEVLEATPAVVGHPQRLLCFTTIASANQYFEMANAKNIVVVDASYIFEDKLIVAYAKLDGVGPIDIVHVDRGASHGLFDALDSSDDAVRRLADVMSDRIRPGTGGDLKVDARRFEPATLPAVIWNPEATVGHMRAREILADPDTPSHMRELAEELLRGSRGRNRMRMTINAACPFIRLLAQQDARDPEVLHVMLGVYNSAILYNAELLTAANAKLFHDQFGALLERTVEFLAERQRIRLDREALDAERRALQPRRSRAWPGHEHVIFFVMIPFTDYGVLEAALRDVVEDRWHCQLLLARDQVLHAELRGSIQAHMEQADAFIAEVSHGNPNVMYELGAARALFAQHPTVLLAHPRTDSGKVELPADLHGLLRVDYAPGDDARALADELETEMRRHKAVTELLDRAGRHRFVSARRIVSLIRPLSFPDDVVQCLAEAFPTRESWEGVHTDAVAMLLEKEGEDTDAAGLLIRKVRNGLGSR